MSAIVPSRSALLLGLLGISSLAEARVPALVRDLGGSAERSGRFVRLRPAGVAAPAVPERGAERGQQ